MIDDKRPELQKTHITDLEPEGDTANGVTGGVIFEVQQDVTINKARGADHTTSPNDPFLRG
jgi:hypothetical protein